MVGSDAVDREAQDQRGALSIRDVYLGCTYGGGYRGVSSQVWRLHELTMLWTSPGISLLDCAGVSNLCGAQALKQAWIALTGC
jgi:hypothetical protein